jgi:hypothetical protein
MRLLATAALALPLVFVLALPGTGSAQQIDFTGSYALDAAQSDNIDQVVSANLSKVRNRLLRPFARGRLTKTNRPYPALTITQQGDEQVTIRYADGSPVVAPTSGQRVGWTREDGEQMEVSATLSQNRLVQTFHAEDGTRVNTFSLSPDGRTLTINVSVDSDRLSSPITYKLVYSKP